MSNLDNILSNQHQVQEIIDAENARIDSKQQTYDNMEFGKQRTIQLNRNFQQRTNAFNWIVAVIFITLAFVVFLMFLDKIVPGISDYTSSAIIIILFIGISYCIYLYLAFIRRNPANFDEILYLNPDEKKNVPEPSKCAKRSTTKPPSSCSSKNSANTIISTTSPLPVNCNVYSGNILPGNTLPGNTLPGNTLPGNTLPGTTIPNIISANIISGNIDTGNITTTPYITTPAPIDENTLAVLNIFSPDNAPSNSMVVNSCSSRTSLDGENYISNANIPKLITNEIYLGSYGRLTILVIHTKKFLFYNLNISVDKFTSYDGIHFTNKNNQALTAKIVTRGPDGPMGQKINGKGIMMTVAGINYYFYLSKYPALLLDGDIFIGPNGQTTIQVMSQNEFILVNPGGNNSNKNTANVLRTYHSTDGTNFIDTTNSENTGLVVVTGPQSPLLQNIYGQAIHLKNKTSGEDVYFYYNGNTVSDINNEISTAALESSSVSEVTSDMPSSDMPSSDMPSSDMPSATSPSPIYSSTATSAPFVTSLPVSDYDSTTPVSVNNSQLSTPIARSTTSKPTAITIRCGKEPDVILIRAYLNSIDGRLPQNNISNSLSEAMIMQLIEQNVTKLTTQDPVRLYCIKVFAIFLNALSDKGNKNQPRPALHDILKKYYPILYSKVQNETYDIASQAVNCYTET